MELYEEFFKEKVYCDDCRYRNIADYDVSLKGSLMPMCSACVDDFSEQALDTNIQETLQFYIVEKL